MKVKNIRDEMYNLCSHKKSSQTLKDILMIAR